jgi:hypothetical protein
MASSAVYGACQSYTHSSTLPRVSYTPKELGGKRAAAVGKDAVGKPESFWLFCMAWGTSSPVQK